MGLFLLNLVVAAVVMAGFFGAIFAVIVGGGKLGCYLACRFMPVLALCIVCTNALADLSQKQQRAIVELHSGWHCRPMGTAFFVGSSTMRTAAHIVTASGGDLHFHANGKKVRCEAHSVDYRRDTAYLSTPGFKAAVRLSESGSVRNGQAVIIYGFPVEGYRSSVGVVYDASCEKVECTARVRGGYSGGCVIDRNTNKVIGILIENQADNRSYSAGRFARVK